MSDRVLMHIGNAVEVGSGAAAISGSVFLNDETGFDELFNMTLSGSDRHFGVFGDLFVRRETRSAVFVDPVRDC